MAENKTKAFDGWLARALAVWLLIAMAETLHGILRALVLVPRIGDLASRQIGVATGSLIIVLIAYVSIGWIGAPRRRDRLAVGALWVILMMSFEVVVGQIAGLDWRRMLADFLPWEGGYMALGMLVLGLSPVAAHWLRGRRFRTEAPRARR